MRLAMINTRMPGVNSFLVRDLRGLMRDGICLDVYLFETQSLDRAFRAEVEASGGSVSSVRFPGGGTEIGATLTEALRHPLRFWSSVGLALRTVLASPAEGIRALAVLPASLALCRRMRRDRVDQVHGMWAGVPASVALWIHRHGDLPVSLSGHAWDLTDRTRLLPEKLRAARGMVVCSQFAYGVVAGVVGPELARKVRVVHHGLTVSQWRFQPDRPRGNAPPLVLAVGRLTAKKGFPYLVAARALLRDRGQTFACEIIGPDGGLGDELTRLIAEHRLETQVRLVGELPPDQVQARMAEAALLAMPSIQPDRGSSDGIPNVVLESMALGTPVVATDAGGIAEVIHPGETGWIVPQKDAAGLADAMAEALHDSERGRRQAVAARAVIESQFNTEALGRIFLEAIGAVRGSVTPGISN
jgi:colanic acid/amylovoran biosynthesis glycosyltransferase